MLPKGIERDFDVLGGVSSEAGLGDQRQRRRRRKWRAARWPGVVGGRVWKEEDEDRDLRMKKHHCPHSCPRGSALPFSGDHLTRVPEKGILVRTRPPKMPFNCVNH